MPDEENSPLLQQEIDFTKSPWGQWGRTCTLFTVAAAMKLILQCLNTTSIENGKAFRKQVQEREAGTGLFTVCNHTSTLDDPGILSTLLPVGWLFQEGKHHGIRWSLGAKEIVYKTKLLGSFFRAGKTLPIERGKGPDQPIMQVAAELAAKGDWVHVFPEGKVGYSGRLQPCKWGIGKLFCDALRHSEKPPIVLPFFHSGMGHVLPNKCTFPRFGKTVHIVVGEPVDLSDLVTSCNKSGQDQQEVWKAITLRIQQSLQELSHRVPPNWDQTAEENESKPPKSPDGPDRVDEAPLPV